MILNSLVIKFIALKFGTSGVFYFSQMKQISQMFITAASVNGQNSLIKHFNKEKSISNKNKTITFYLFTIFTLIISVITFNILFGQIFVKYFSGFNLFITSFRFSLSLIVVLGTFNFLFSSFLLANNFLLANSLFQLVTSFSSFFAFVIILFYPSFNYFPIIIIFGYLSSFIFLFIYSRFSRLYFLNIFSFIDYKLINFKLIRSHISSSVVFLITSVLSLYVVITLRNLYLINFNIVKAGIYDAAWSLSNLYNIFFLSSISSLYLPQFSALTKIEEAGKKINNGIFLNLIIGTTMILFLIIFNPFVINILYSKFFIDAKNILRWSLIGDYFKFSSWIFGLLLIACYPLKYFLISELVNQFILFLIVYVLLKFKIFEAYGISYLISQIFYFLYLTFYFIYNRKVVLEKKTIITWLLCLFIVLLFSICFW